MSYLVSHNPQYDEEVGFAQKQNQPPPKPTSNKKVKHIALAVAVIGIVGAITTVGLVFGTDVFVSSNTSELPQTTSAPVVDPTSTPTQFITPAPTKTGETPSPTPQATTPAPTKPDETPSPTNPGETPAPTNTTPVPTTTPPVSTVSPTPSGEYDVQGPYPPITALEQALVPASTRAIEFVLKAINPPNSVKGSLLAALSGTCPNYTYTWVRDQALVFQPLLHYYETSGDNPTRQLFETVLQDYASFTHTVYSKNNGDSDNEGNLWTLADAKYYPDGSMYKAGWCDPQTDGPSVRASVLIRFANRYEEIHGDSDTYVQDYLYKSTLDNQVNPILRDLVFIKDAWRWNACEPWEEVRGDHFYNKIQARRAMKYGVEFLEKKGGDQSIINALNEQISAITQSIDAHKQTIDGKPLIRTTLDQGRLDDIQTVLATLHSWAEVDGYYKPTDEIVQANILFTMKSFESMYGINSLDNLLTPDLGVALGRYAGDVYNGGDCNYPESVCPSPCGGQPWFLATNAIAEVLYRMVLEYRGAGLITITEMNRPFFQYFGGGKYLWSDSLPKTVESNSAEYKHLMMALVHAGDAQLRRTIRHSGEGYKLDEQFNADTGMMMSAGDLTWSYASLLTANAARHMINVKEMMESYTPSNGEVDVEIVISQVAMGVPKVFLVKEGESACDSVEAHYRRHTSFNGRESSEWSAFVRVPASGTVKFRAVATEEDCNSTRNSDVTRTIESTATNPIEAYYYAWGN